jgi:pilus assembly protein CpaB
MARVISMPGASDGRSRVLLVAGGVFAVVAALLVFVALQSRSDSQSTSSSSFVPVVVAARDVGANTTLTSDMLKIKSVPPDVALSGAYGRMDALVGKVTRYPVSQGQQLTSSVLGAGAIANDDDLSYALLPGKRAVGVEVSKVTGVDGLLLPGNSVDVIGVFDQNATGTAKAVTLLQNVVVLAVGQEAQQPAPRSTNSSDANASSAADKDAKRQPEATTVALAVSPADAQLLALAQDNGKIWLTLRPAGETDTPPLGEQVLPGASDGGSTQ